MNVQWELTPVQDLVVSVIILRVGTVVSGFPTADSLFQISFSSFEMDVFCGLFPHTEIPRLAQVVKADSPGMVLVVMMLMNALKLLMNSETQ